MSSYTRKRGLNLAARLRRKDAHIIHQLVEENRQMENRLRTLEEAAFDLTFRLRQHEKLTVPIDPQYERLGG